VAARSYGVAYGREFFLKSFFTQQSFVGELVPRAERQRSRYERAATEAEHFPQGREHPST